MTNYSICPCNLRICLNVVNELNILYNYNLQYCNYDNKTLISNANLNEKFYVIYQNNLHICNYDTNKNYITMSKMGIINNLEQKNNNLRNELNEKNNKISDLENKLRNYAKIEKNYNEGLKIIQEKESKIMNLQNNLQNKENQIININNSDRKKQKKIDELKNKIKILEQIVNELNSQIKILNTESSQKDYIINENKNKFERDKNELTLLKKELNEKKIAIEKLSKQNDENQRNINQLNKNIKELNSDVQNKNDKIKELDINEQNKENDFNKLKEQLKINSEYIKRLENEKENYKKDINETISQKEKIKKDYLIKEENEKNMNKKLEENEKLKEEQNKKIKKLTEDNNFLTLAINKDLGTLKKFHELGLLTNISINNINNSCIQIDPKTNQFIFNNNSIKNYEEYDESNLKDFYDIIVNIKSVKDIGKGWEIKMTPEGEKNFKKYRNKELIKIGVIGNSNKGKSFILSRISKIILPSGTSIRTEGLSIKYPELKEFKNRKIILLDSAGLETPVLNDNDGEEEEEEEEDDDEGKENNIKNNKKKEDNDKKENNKIENLKANDKDKNENKNEYDEQTEEKMNNSLFKEKSREKLITELFLQNYIIKNSDILIIVVGILSYSEQKTLNKIKIDLQKLKIKNPLYIIHNLKTYTKISQVKDYIKKFLKKSATFQIKKGHNTSTELKTENGIYFFEKNSEQVIYHLIFANEGSEAGDYYNNYTLQFIEKAYQHVTNIKPFDVIKTIKERFCELSTEIFEKTNENQKVFKKEDIVDDEEIIKNKIIKLKTPQTIILKKCLIDELGFSNLRRNGFEPDYNYYKENDKVVVKVEVPGNSDINSNIEHSGDCTFIRLDGSKRRDKKPENKSDNIRSTREYGEFNLDIPLKTEDYNLKNIDPKVEFKKGVYILEFECEKKLEKYIYKGNEEDDI